MNTYCLNQNWTMRERGGSIFYHADVPAMAANTLYEHGAIEDPYYGENEWKTYEELKKDYEFTNTFLMTEEFLQGDELILRCEGLDTVADIFINEIPVASVSDMHRTYEFPIMPYVRQGENTIRILFKSAIAHALEQHKKEPYYTTSDTVDGFCLVRKAHSTYGWDWGPKLPDVGIWKNISILSYETAKISDIYIRQSHQNDQVELSCEVATSSCAGKDMDELTLTIRLTAPDGSVTEHFCGDVGAHNVYNIPVHNPQLWWCHGFGAQPLYLVEFFLKRDDVLLESRKQRIGLRTLTVRREKDIWGESFEFCINGVSIFAMGANYIPEDSLYPRCSKKRTEQLLRQCIKANYNCIRVWGGGYFCDDYFYDLCDEYGLIVWQDLLFACGVYRLHDDFVENVVQETIDNVTRLRHHASIGLWCGNNELEWGWSSWDMGFGDKPGDKADYIKLFEWILPQTVKQVDPDRFYWLASPSSGGSFDEPNDQNRGDVHYWEVWHRQRPFTEYRKYHFRFCSEFGFQSFPSVKTIDAFACAEDKNIFSPVMENHQKNGGANGLILYYLSAYFQYPADFDTLIYVSQILQAEAIRYGVEHWRSNRGRCMGALYWQLNDCWPVASWSSIDYYGRWKPLHYYAKKFYAPLLLSALENQGQVDFVVSNETMEAVRIAVIWRLRDCLGSVLQEERIESTAAPLQAKSCGFRDFADFSCNADAARRHYLEYCLLKDEEEVSTGTVLFCRPKHFKFQDPQISYTIEEACDAYLLKITTETFAKYVFAESPDFDFIASDNCFDLSKSQIKTIEIRKEDITKDRQPYVPSPSEFHRMTILSAYDIR